MLLNYYIMKRVLANIDWNNMISASSIRNYMLDDPLIDWLKYYNITDINSKPRINTSCKKIKIDNEPTINTFNQFIMNEGHVFEKNVINKLKEKYNIVQVAESNDARSVDKYLETIKLIEKKIDIIYQGILHDTINNLYGAPDLLIRSDIFEQMFNIKTSNPVHYVVVDIKHSVLNLTQNKINLCNNNSMPAYKGQLLVYNRILGLIQGYQPQCAYILGKRWTYTKNGCTKTGDDLMESIGTVDYNGFDKDVNDKVDKAIEWLHRMRTHGHKWSLLPPSCSELYPNLKNDKEYHSLKIKLNDKINDITSVWWCGINKRKIAHKKKIYSWKNKRCTAENLEFKSGKISTTINHILNINRKRKFTIRTEDLVKDDTWRNFGDKILEFYIDYETIANNIGQLMEDSLETDIVFMVGIGWEENNTWQYKSFVAKESTIQGELEMMEDFWYFINDKMIELKYYNTKFIHWTQAEPIFYKKFMAKHNDKKIDMLDFYDLHRLFLDNNIIVSGALNFSLKTIANALFKNTKIKTSWNTTNQCANGLNAMYLAYQLYSTGQDIDNKIMKDIIQYNEIDCKVMYEIMSFLRKTA